MEEDGGQRVRSISSKERFVPAAPSIRRHFLGTAFPADWSTPHLDSLIDESAPVSYGILMPGNHVPDGVPVIKVKDYVDGRLSLERVMRTSREIDAQYERSRVRAGDILISIRGGTGDLAIVPAELDGANITQDTARLRANKSVVSRFLFHALRGEFVSTQIQLDTIGQAVTGINIGSLRRLVIPVPPRQEQTKIADVLGTWDEALEKLDALIAAKERRKQSLMQQLLTGKRRLPGSPAAVQFVRASDIFTSRTERNARGVPILSVTQDQGVVARDSLDRKISHSVETHGSYKVIHPGDFVISLRSFQGGLEYSQGLGAVSPAYHVIRPVKEIDREFYRHYFKSAHFVGHLAVAVIGIRDGKQISFADFGFMKLPYPHPDDQRRIGQLLSAAAVELRLLRDQRAAVDQQKRGLMQQLLTGKTRVKVA